MKKGFTLIELLVVVLIIGILSAVALPQYQTAVDKAHYTNMMSAVRALKEAQGLYYLANGSYSEDLHDFEGSLPTGCNIASSWASCPTFTLIFNTSGQVYGLLNVGIRNACMMWYRYGHSSYGKIDCYAYKEDGERGRRLCKSLGGVHEGEDNSNCSGTCTIYTLP